MGLPYEIDFGKWQCAFRLVQIIPNLIFSFCVDVALYPPTENRNTFKKIANGVKNYRINLR